LQDTSLVKGSGYESEIAGLEGQVVKVRRDHQLFKFLKLYLYYILFKSSYALKGTHARDFIVRFSPFYGIIQ
jgi:hypothetical protein